MIKNLIFDLDGVLVDTRDIHYEALNYALKKNDLPIISYNDHLRVFDGLPTLKKIEIINQKNKISELKKKKIVKLKNKQTNNLLKKKIKYDKRVEKIFKKLSINYKISIASNAIKKTLDICINNLKIKRYIHTYLSNQDVKNSKPHPEIYMKMMLNMNARPKETLIIEDSHYGRVAAKESGAFLFPVDNIKDVNLEKINTMIKEINSIEKYKDKMDSWDDKMLNIIVPMAGAGQRFIDAGYSFPKPLIEVFKKPMIQWVIDCININANYTFIIRKEHQEKYNIISLLKILKPNCKIIEVDNLTEGAACTVLLAKKIINNNNPLIICNSDQYFKWNSSQAMYKFKKSNVDGAILTFKAIHPKWSYAKTNKKGDVIEVAEKRIISEDATVGLYYWKKGKEFVSNAERMIKKNIRVNNEFYVCPVYNEAILNNKKIVISKVEEMQGLGTPEDLDDFIRNNKK